MLVEQKVEISAKPPHVVDVGRQNITDKDHPPRRFLSEDDQNELMLLRDKLTEFAFRIGDIARKYVNGIFDVGQNVSAFEVYAEVGRFCGRSARTVRYYAETSAFYPQEVRDRYHMLSFSHFVLARSYGEEWDIVLTLAAGNISLSVEELEKRLKYASEAGVIGYGTKVERGEMREISPISGSPPIDMAFDRVQEVQKELIARAFGVPSEFITGSFTYNNMDAAEIISGVALSLGRFERWLMQSAESGQIDQKPLASSLLAVQCLRAAIAELRITLSVCQG